MSSNSALHIGVFGDTGNPLESVTVTGNVLTGGGGWNSDRHGVQIGRRHPPRCSRVAFHVTMTDNVMRGALRSGLYVDLYPQQRQPADNTIDGPAAQGIRIRSGVSGSGTFTPNTVQNLRAGQVAYPERLGEHLRDVVLTGNSWQ